MWNASHDWKRGNSLEGVNLKNMLIVGAETEKLNCDWVAMNFVSFFFEFYLIG